MASAAHSAKLRTAGMEVKPPSAKASISADAASVMDGPASASASPTRCGTGTACLRRAAGRGGAVTQRGLGAQLGS